MSSAVAVVASSSTVTLTAAAPSTDADAKVSSLACTVIELTGSLTSTRISQTPSKACSSRRSDSDTS